MGSHQQPIRDQHKSRKNRPEQTNIRVLGPLLCFQMPARTPANFRTTICYSSAPGTADENSN